MHLARAGLQELKQTNQSIIGFWGAPPLSAFQDAASRFPGLEFFDLDVFYEQQPSTKIIPDAYCHIIRNCVDNAVALGSQLKLILAAGGKEKCDSGRFAAKLLDNLLNAEVIVTINEESHISFQPLLSTSRGPLKKRTVRIMESIVEPLSEPERTSAFIMNCEPTCGFWGTPPHPIELLDLFPDTTHIYGWTRCVEEGRPADLELEMYVPDNLPIIFFSQGFCAKAMLAKHLADQHRGMHVDVHDSLGAATMAKIEAFIRLSGASK